jgi:hypothetical protein
MTDFANLKTNLTLEFSPHLNSLSVEHIAIFFDSIRTLMHSYVAASELDRRMFLVLDNSIVQDFKHGAIPRRRMRALGYTAFCRFVARWSSLPSCLALSPVAIYEHCGRKPAASPQAAHALMLELRGILRECALPITTINFTDPASLYRRLLDIHADADYLEVFANQIDASDWEHDMRAPHGGEILAVALAEKAIPSDMPLKYFSPYYVRKVFRSRIEMHISTQSQGVFGPKPLLSGEATVSLSKLNKISKLGVLKGLGDIDLLQTCDLSYQYTQSVDYLFLGQTFDGGLAETLHFHGHFMQSRCVVGGESSQSEKADDMVRFMFSNPFAEQEKRLKKMAVVAEDFLEHIWRICDAAASAQTDL